MWRTALGATVGGLAGTGAAVLILRVGYAAMASIKQQSYEVEPSAVYLVLALGAGFGSVCGALAGLASALVRASREGRPSG